MEELKLSIRQAETVARYLRDTYGVKISASACRWQTPEQVAIRYLGSKAPKIKVNALVNEILTKALGMSVEV